MAYTDIDKPSDYFETNLHTGTGSTHNITSLDFAPNFVWLKSRTQGGTGYNGMHFLFDTIRGATKRLRANDNSAEATSSASLTSFNSDGFTLGSDDIVNFNGDAFVSWNWKAGTSFTNDASATGIGSLDSSGSVNEEAGFAIVSYTGNETASTLKHGLSTVPQVIIVKGRIAARDWIVGHHTQGWTTSAMLNETTAYSNQTHWNNTAPTSSVFTIEGGTNSNVNTNSAAYIAYVFSERQGYSKFGSYVGNGQDTPNGVFTYLGFTPAFILIKATDINSWVIVDNKRPADSNPVDSSLAADSNAAETTGDSNTTFDFLSNGFRTNGNSGNNNSSGQEYIFMAFAESPFVSSTGVPATAR